MAHPLIGFDIIGPAFDRALEGINGSLVAPLQMHDMGEVEIRLDQVGLEPDRGLIGRFRVFQSLHVPQGIAPVHVVLGGFRPQRKDGIVSRHRLVVALEFLQHIAQIIVRFSQLWRHGNRAPIGYERLVQTVQLLQRVAEVEPGRRQLWIEFHGTPQRL